MWERGSRQASVSWLAHQSRPHKYLPSWQVGSEDYTETSSVLVTKTNLEPWRKTAENQVDVAYSTWWEAVCWCARVVRRHNHR